MNHLRILHLLLLGLFILIGCDKPGEDGQGGGTSSSTNRRIEIQNIFPPTLPSVTRDSFDVTVKGHDLYQGVYVHLEVKSHASSSCIAFIDSSLFITSGMPSGTIKVRTDSLQSSCVSQNSVFRVVVWFRDTLDNIRRDSAYYQWGSPSNTGNTLSAYVERWRMPYVSSILADTLGKCVIRSFNPGSSSSDSNYIKLTINFATLHPTNKDSTFEASSEEGLTYLCDWYSFDHDSDLAINNKIIYAKSNTFNPLLVGWSQSLGNYPPINHRDWSYIFYKNIADFFTPSGTVNDTTYGNLTAFHEMLHQMGNIHNDYRAHKIHTGYFAYKCALWDEDNHFTEELQNHRYTNKFRVCMNHTLALRSFRNVTPLDNTGGNVIYTQFVASNPFLSSAGTKNGDKYSITMSLPKQEYKKYEPVIAKLNLVNNDKNPLEIYNVYDDLSGEPNFYIKDKFGNIYDNRHRLGSYINAYTADVNPSDSLVFSMTLNNWGKETSYFSNLSFDEVYFSQWGYFPAGEYTAYFFCDLRIPKGNIIKIISNEVTFKVTELLQEDEEILKLYKQENYNEVLNKYPNNVFAEHVLMWKMLPYWIKVSPSTETDYNQFIQVYPNSMYLYSWRFMLPYIKAAEIKEGSFQKGLDYLLNRTEPESTASKSLSNLPFTTIIKNHGKFIEKNK